MAHFLKAGFKKFKVKQDTIARQIGYPQPGISAMLSGKVAIPKNIEIQMMKLLLKIMEAKDGLQNQR